MTSELSNSGLLVNLADQKQGNLHTSSIWKEQQYIDKQTPYTSITNPSLQDFSFAKYVEC